MPTATRRQARASHDRTSTSDAPNIWSNENSLNAGVLDEDAAVTQAPFNRNPLLEAQRARLADMDAEMEAQQVDDDEQSEEGNKLILMPVFCSTC